MALIKNFDRKTTEAVCQRFELPPRLTPFFGAERLEANRCLRWLESRKSIDNSLLYQRLNRFKTELILYMIAASRSERVKKYISHFYTHLRTVQVLTTGQNLKDMGLTPGPIYREILDAVRYARLNGKLKSKDDEIEFIRHYVS